MSTNIPNRAILLLRPLVTPIAVLSTIAIAYADLTSRYSAVVVILYLIPLLLLLRSPNRGAAIGLAAGYTSLILLGAAGAPSFSPKLAYAIRGMVIGVVWTTTLLLLRAKRAEERLYQAQKEQEVIFHSTPAMIWYKDTNNRILRANRLAAESLGLPIEAIEGRSTYDLYPAEAEKYYQDDLEVIRTGQPKFGIVEAYQGGSGEKRWIRTDKVPYRDKDGRSGGVIVFSVDITDSEQLAAIEAAMDGIGVIDGEGLCVYANQALAALCGRTRPQELLGKSWRDWYGPEELQRFDRNVLPRLAASGSWRGEAIGLAGDGRTWPHELSLTAVEGRGFICVLRDITDRKMAEEALRASEERLRQSQKMDAIGRLAGGIAHDFNNLLTVVTGYSQLLLRRLAADDPVFHKIEQIHVAGQRATALTSQLLAFSRKQPLHPREINLNAVLTTLLPTLRSILGETVQLVTELDPALGWVRTDRALLDQALMNLVLNARDAMPGGGKLYIKTANMEGRRELLGKQGLSMPGTHVILSIRDTGGGMDAYTREHCFEPFFTTKGRDKAMGLGLSTVFAFVDQHGGHIEIDSAVGQGTTVAIQLPQTPAPETAAELRPTSDALVGGMETVLLVEDEAIVRDVVRRMLESLGYTVVEAADGQEALRWCGTYKAPIHLLLTDVIMPGLNGRELAEQVLALRPDIRVLYMSGYTDDVELFPHDGARERHFLAKPVTPETLAPKVRQALDAEA